MRKTFAPIAILTSLIVGLPAHAQMADMQGQMQYPGFQPHQYNTAQGQFAQAFQEAAPQMIAAQQMSPYQMQEQAIQQAQQMQQMHEQKQQREMEANVSYDQQNWNQMPQQQQFKNPKGKSALKKMVGGLGSLVKTSVQVAAPIAATGGALAGSYFLMRATMPTGYMPMMYGGGPMFMPMYR